MTVVIGIDPHKASHTATAIGPGCVEAVELLQGLPAGPQAGVGVQEGVEAGPVCVCEGVAASQQREPGPEHLGVERGLGAFRTALDVAAHRGEPR